MIGRASRVVLVVQQSVLQLKQAARILGTVCNEIGIPTTAFWSWSTDT